MSRRLGNPPPFAEGLRGVLNSFDLDSDLDPSEGIIRSMTPPYLPAGPAHDADPAHPIRAYRFFFSIFCNRFFERIFHEICFPSGTPKSPKIAPGAEKVRSAPAPDAIFGAVAVRNRFRGRFLTKKHQKNDSCFFDF